MTNVDTTIADRKPGDGEQPKNAAPPMQVKRLRDYLEANHPGAATVGEAPADTAIRLLQGISAQPAGSAEVVEAAEIREYVAVRCTEPYCNKTEGHLGEHGWVNFG